MTRHNQGTGRDRPDACRAYTVLGGGFGCRLLQYRYV
jgi:hypothetical protein